MKLTDLVHGNPCLRRATMKTTLVGVPQPFGQRVGEGGLEPPRPFEHWHLKPARLPFRHSPERRFDASNEPPFIHRNQGNLVLDYDRCDEQQYCPSGRSIRSARCVS